VGSRTSTTPTARPLTRTGLPMGRP
jgi:hypothetical protein